MAGKDWDELDLASERPAGSPSSSSSSSTPPAKKRGGRVARLGWLLALLFAAAGAALAGLALDGRLEERAQLARARDEAAGERRQRFVAEDKVLVVEKARAAEKSRAARLASILAPTLDKKDGEVVAQENRVVVFLADENLFGRDEAELTTRGRETLTRLSAPLADLKDQQILVGGHSEETLRSEKFPSNWELSAARAVSVVRFLVETVGADPRHTSAAAYGEFHPRPPPGGKNHRLEIVLTPVPPPVIAPAPKLTPRPSPSPRAK